MASQRRPGVFGLLEDGFPSLDTARTELSDRGSFPSGPAQAAQFPVGVITIELPTAEEMLAADPEDGEPEYSPPDRYRDVEVQGEVVKVRCNPRWLVVGKQIAAAEKVDEAQNNAFLRLVKRRKPERRAEIASSLNPLFRQKGKWALVDALEGLTHDS